MSKSGDFSYIEVVPNQFETRFRTAVIDPLLVYIPASVHPNTITFTSMAVVCCLSVLGIAAQLSSAWAALWMRLVLAVFIIVYAILDCLDGQHARNTKQTSKLGELLDHCTDALGIPLTTAACCWAMQADNASFTTSMVLAIMTFNSQLVLYHQSGQFILCGTDGPKAQVSTSIAMAIMAVLLYNVTRSASVAAVAVLIVSVVGILAMGGNVSFYLSQLKGGWVKTLGCMIPIVVISGLFLLQADPIDVWYGNPATVTGAGCQFLSSVAYCLVLSNVSFRSSSRWVFHALLKTPFNSLDVVIIVHTLVLVAVHTACVWGIIPAPLQPLLPVVPFVSAAHCFVATVLDGRVVLQALLVRQAAKSH